MRRIGLAFLVALAFAAPAFAGPEDDLRRVVKESVDSGEPVTALLQGFMSLGNFELGGDSVRAAITAAGAPMDGPIGQVLGNVTKLKKKGDRIEIARSGSSVFPIVVDNKPVAFIGLDKKVEFRVGRDGNATVIDKMDGLEIGEARDSLYTLKNLKYEKVPGKRIITIVAGWGFINKTKTIEIKDAPVLPPPVITPVAPPPAATPPVITPAAPVPPPVEVVSENIAPVSTGSTGSDSVNVSVTAPIESGVVSEGETAGLPLPSVGVSGAGSAPRTPALADGRMPAQQTTTQQTQKTAPQQQVAPLGKRQGLIEQLPGR